MSLTSAKTGSIALAFVRQAAESLQRRGIDPAPLLLQAGLPEDLAAAGELRVRAEAFGALWLAIAARLDDELFGLDSHRLKVGSFATLCHLMLHTRKLGEALARGTRLLNLLLDETRVGVELQGTQAELYLEHRGGAPGPRVFAHETLLVMLPGLMCWLIGRRIPVRRARFAYPRPAWWTEYEVLFSGTLEFGSARTGLVFDAVELEAPVVQSERSAKEFLRQAPQSFILKYKDPRSQAARIRRRLRAAPPAQWPSFEALAEEFGSSPSTLRRRLEQDGTSFRAIKDALRRDLAIRYLTRSDDTVLDIAQALGFAEPSAFHRAFRHWVGVSPGDYRRGATRG